MSPPLGAHVSVAGGLALAFERGREIGCDALQIFVKNASQWRARPLAAGEVEAFGAARVAAGEPPLVAHAAYLINLCAVDPAILEKSRAALADEVLRAGALGVGGVVVHPGAHLGAGEDAGLTAIAASLDEIAGRVAPGPAARLLIEATAGQGSVLGHRLEQLAAIRERAASGAGLGFCLDTCHAFAAGYDVGSAAAVEDFLGEVDRALGLDSIACVHLNDSVGELGSRKDRHANLGEGRIGLEGFRRLLAEPRLARVPMILETPLGDDERGHARDLVVLRSLLG
jgi:deoxyribonuclease-4